MKMDLLSFTPRVISWILLKILNCYRSLSLFLSLSPRWKCMIHLILYEFSRSFIAVLYLKFEYKIQMYVQFGLNHFECPYCPGFNFSVPVIHWEHKCKSNHTWWETWHENFLRVSLSFVTSRILKELLAFRILQKLFFSRFPCSNFLVGFLGFFSIFLNCYFLLCLDVNCELLLKSRPFTP